LAVLSGGGSTVLGRGRVGKVAVEKKQKGESWEKGFDKPSDF